jgi:dodecin
VSQRGHSVGAFAGFSGSALHALCSVLNALSRQICLEKSLKGATLFFYAGKVGDDIFVGDVPSHLRDGGIMSEHVYKQVELTGSSKTSIEDAIQGAIAKAAKTLHNLHWFQVVETRGYIENGKVDYWQVTIKLGFRVDE